MNRKSAAVHVIRLFAEQIEKLGVDHGNEEIERAVRIGHDKKQRGFLVSELVQFQLVIHCDLPKFLNIEGSKTSTAGNIDRLRSFTRRKLIFLILPYSEVVRLAAFQFFECQINGILKVLIVFTHFHRIDHFDQRGKILFLLGRFVVDIPDQRRVEKRLSLLPEIIAALAVAFGVGNQRRYQLENIFFGVDILKRIVVVRFPEVDRVEDFDLVVVPLEQLSALDDNGAFRKRFVNTENDNSLKK